MQQYRIRLFQWKGAQYLGSFTIESEVNAQDSVESRQQIDSIVRAGLNGRQFAEVQHELVAWNVSIRNADKFALRDCFRANPVEFAESAILGAA